MNQPTPLAVDAYSRFMVRHFDDRDLIGVSTGFQGIFGRPETFSQTVFQPNSKLVEIDIVRGNERHAAMIHRGNNSRPIQGQANTSEQRYTTFSRQYPLMEEEGDINSDQILNRLAGESPYSSRTRMERQRELGAIAHTEQVRRILRACERLSAQSLLRGIQDGIFGTSNSDLQYDFHRLATHEVTPAAAWSTITTDILGDIDTGCDLIRADGKIKPDCLILGGDAMSAIVANTAIKDQADNRRFELIEVSLNNPVPPNLMFMVQNGFNPRGRLRTPKGYELWMWTYVDGYTSDAGAFTPYMPVDEAVLFSSQMRADRYFGPPEHLPLTQADRVFFQETFGFGVDMGPGIPNITAGTGVVRPDMFYFDAYRGANRKTITCRTQAAPIFATTMTDAIVTFIDVNG
jgi:hypothetical protein